MRLDDMPELLQDALSAKKHRSFYEYYDFTSRLNAITADILRTPLQGAPRVAYIESMCMELLCHSLDYVLRQDGGDAALRISSSEREALNKAKEFLLEEYANPPTVLELSKRIGINRNKLYYGFKQLTGKPISQFIQETRLEEGRRLLRQTDLRISEVSQSRGPCAGPHRSNRALLTDRELTGREKPPGPCGIGPRRRGADTSYAPPRRAPG